MLEEKPVEPLTLPAEKGRKKRCNSKDHEGNRWLPVREFYRTSIRGRKVAPDGTYYRKAHCRKCVAIKNKREGRSNNTKTPEAKEKYRKIQAARRRAYRRLAAMNEDGFRFFFEQELQSEGITDYAYRSPNYDYQGEVG